MNIDERLEALTQSVAPVASIHKDTAVQLKSTDRQIKRLGKYIRAVGTLVLDHEARIRQIETPDQDDEDDDQDAKN